MDKTFAGARLRNLRVERRLTQSELARLLEISPSYLNQIEHNARPLTVAVLLKITDLFGVDAGFFAEQDTTRLVAELRDALSEADPGLTASAAEIIDVATEQPTVARAVLTLHRRYRALADQLAAATGPGSDATLSPHEEVRDFFYDRGTTSTSSTGQPSNSPTTSAWTAATSGARWSSGYGTTTQSRWSRRRTRTLTATSYNASIQTGASCGCHPSWTTASRPSGWPTSWPTSSSPTRSRPSPTSRTSTT